MNKTNILITGCCGNIGSNILDYIVDNYNECNIICIDNLYNGSQENLSYASLNTIKNNNLLYTKKNLDITNHEQLEQMFFYYNPHYVFHQASYLTLDTKQCPQKAIETNVMGFVNVVDCCLKYKVNKLVFASSASVYGNPDEFPTNEEHHFKNNKLLYGLTKIIDEQLANYFADEEGLKFVGLRYFNVVGPRQSTRNVYTQIVPKWVNAFLKGEDIVVYGDGSQTMDIISAKDVARFNVLAMEKEDLYRGNKEGFSGYLNVGTGIETSVLQLLHIVKELLIIYDVDVNKSKITFQEHDPNLVKRRKADVVLLHQYLGTHQQNAVRVIEECVKHYLKKK